MRKSIDFYTVCTLPLFYCFSLFLVPPSLPPPPFESPQIPIDFDPDWILHSLVPLLSICSYVHHPCVAQSLYYIMDNYDIIITPPSILTIKKNLLHNNLSIRITILKLTPSPYFTERTTWNANIL